MDLIERLEASGGVGIDAAKEIVRLAAQVDELRQSLVGGIELVRGNKTTCDQMTAWANANERLLARQK